MFAFVRLLAGREQPLLVDKAVEIARSYCPAVPLILNKRMDDTDSAVLVVLDNLATAQQSGCAGEFRILGEETAHLYLGIYARFELAIDFHDIIRIDQGGRVGLFGRHRTDSLGLSNFAC